MMKEFEMLLLRTNEMSDADSPFKDDYLTLIDRKGLITLLSFNGTNWWVWDCPFNTIYNTLGE